jgi:hypothetical protein
MNHPNLRWRREQEWGCRWDLFGTVDRYPALAAVAIPARTERLTLVGDGFAPTEKQRAWLLGIHQRLRSQR